MEVKYSAVGRNSNIELLRIMCMLSIVGTHYVVHGTGGSSTGINGVIETFILLWVEIAVACFVLISGFYSINRVTGIETKLKYLVIDRIFYAMTISVIFLCMGNIKLNLYNIAFAVIPDIMTRHNFVASFLVLYLLIPFINKMVYKLEYREYKKFIILLTIIMSLWPTIMGTVKGWNNNVYSYVGYMIYLYLLGGFLKAVMDNKPEIVTKKIAGGYCVSIILVLISGFASKGQDVFLTEIIGVQFQYELLVIYCSVMTFLVFICQPCRTIKIINEIAASNFAVILIHDDPLVRGWLWRNFLKCSGFSNLPTGSFLIYTVFSILGVYIFCIIIDKLYRISVRRVLILVMSTINNRVG